MKKRLKRRWHVFIALAGERISKENPWEWVATFRDRADAKTFAYRCSTTDGGLPALLPALPREPSGWKTKISSNPKP